MTIIIADQSLKGNQITGFHVLTCIAFFAMKILNIHITEGSTTVRERNEMSRGK